MQTLDFVSGLHNCLEFSQPLSCLYQAMQTRKTFSIAYLKDVNPQEAKKGTYVGANLLFLPMKNKITFFYPLLTVNCSSILYFSSQVMEVLFRFTQVIFQDGEWCPSH